MHDLTRSLVLAASLGACTQSAPAPGPELVEITDQLEETNTRLAEIADRLDAIESRLDARDSAMEARLERMRSARRDLPSTLSPAPTPQAEKLDPKKLDEGIVCAENVCKLQRALLEEILANPSTLARSARVIPSMDDGVQQGFKLYGMRPGTVLARLGFENGDLVETINGFELDSPDKALETYAKLRTAKAVTVAIRRRGKPHELKIEIE